MPLTREQAAQLWREALTSLSSERIMTDEKWEEFLPTTMGTESDPDSRTATLMSRVSFIQKMVAHNLSNLLAARAQPVPCTPEEAFEELSAIYMEYLINLLSTAVSVGMRLPDMQTLGATSAVVDSRSGLDVPTRLDS